MIARRALLAAAALAFVVAAIPGRPARAGTEEFSTFSPEAQEPDDESLIDHMLVRPPRAWRDEYLRAPQALETSQGCLTSGLWTIVTNLKVQAPLGDRARLGVLYRDNESDRATYQYVDFSFRFPTRVGTPGAMFRPLADKSRQDFAVTWETGSDTTAFGLQLVFNVEDVFNNLWAFRQTQVGGLSEPYERRPYEPAFRVTAQQPGWRAEASAQYLTPSRKQVVDFLGTGATRLATLWGTLASALVEADVRGTTWELSADNQQAASTDVPADYSTPDARDFRRQWTAGVSARRRVTAKFTAEARWLYQGRTENHGPPVGPRTFEGVDRALQLDTWYQWRPHLAARAGLLYDKISIDRTEPSPIFSWGSRKESRAYIGVMARFGRVSVHAIEGIELDHELYKVSGIHDKGFLHLQTTF